MVFSIFQANKRAKAPEVNDNFAFISGNRLIAINASTGAPIGTFPIGDLTAITNGSLAGDILGRTGSSLKVYSATGVLIGSVSYDSLLNLQDASQTQKGVVELATNAEVTAGTDTQRAITPVGLIAAFANSKTTNGYTYLPNGLIMQWGSQNESNIGTFPIAFPNACLSLIATANLNSFSSDGSVTTSYIVSNSQFRVRIGADNGNLLYWVAIGY